MSVSGIPGISPAPYPQPPAETPSLIQAAIDNRPDEIRHLLAIGNISDSVHEEAIEKAVLGSHLDALKVLMQTDRHCGIALAYAIHHGIKITWALRAEANKPIDAFCFAAEKAVLNDWKDVLRTLVQITDDCREGALLLAITYAAPDHMDLVDEFLKKAEDPASLLERAVAMAALKGRLSALKALIKTDKHRAIAIVYLASENPHLIPALFESAKDPESVREIATSFAAAMDKQKALHLLMKTDKHRGIAIASAISNNLSHLIPAILKDAENLKSVRTYADGATLLESTNSLLEGWARKDHQRGIEIGQGPIDTDLMDSHLKDALNRPYVFKTAIETARLNGNQNWADRLEACSRTYLQRIASSTAKEHGWDKDTRLKIEVPNERN
ncbi:MAG TPA: hypothetical protein VLE89_04590 [Chlamydiales bacterium]|nr:hypothetical protein [Chlamydiales bacterium]